MYILSFKHICRDLKPENLLLRSLTDDMSIKLADFGFAKVVKEPNSLTTQCGTPVSFLDVVSNENAQTI